MRSRGSTGNASGPGASDDPAEAVGPKILGQHEWYAREHQSGKV